MLHIRDLSTLRGTQPTRGLLSAATRNKDKKRREDPPKKDDKIIELNDVVIQIEEETEEVPENIIEAPKNNQYCCFFVSISVPTFHYLFTLIQNFDGLP